MKNESQSLWEFQDEKTMFSHLIGKSFGEKPEEKLNFIREEKRKMAEIISGHLGLGSKSVVAEIGSGTGFVSTHIASVVKKLHCCDISASFLEAAKKECHERKNISFHHISSARLSPIPDRSLNAIYSLNTFIHFNLYDIFHYFQEFRRVLKPGGRVWFDIANSDSFPGGIPPLFLEMSDLYAKVPHGLALLVQYQSPRAVAGIAMHFGFRLMAEINDAAPSPWMLFQKEKIPGQ